MSLIDWFKALFWENRESIQIQERSSNVVAKIYKKWKDCRCDSRIEKGIMEEKSITNSKEPQVLNKIMSDEKKLYF